MLTLKSAFNAFSAGLHCALHSRTTKVRYKIGCLLLANST